MKIDADQYVESPKRKGRGRSAASLAIVAKLQDLSAEIAPCSVRAYCYQLFIAGYIDSMSKNNTNKVSKLLVDARESGEIGWHDVVDETREAETVSQWSDPESPLNAAVIGYRRNNWQEQPYRVEIWCEKGTQRGTLKPVLDGYGVTLRVMHGYGSATALNEIAEATQSGKPLIAFYVGDYDPSGLHMSEVDLPERIARYGGSLDLVRIALTREDVWPGTTLPSFDVIDKVSDPRYEWFIEHFGLRCWEVDALRPDVLRKRVAAAIDHVLDSDAWEHSKIIEAAEVGSMDSFLKIWHSTISGQASKYSEAPDEPFPSVRVVHHDRDEPKGDS